MKYFVIVPSIDKSGPTNLALDLAFAASKLTIFDVEIHYVKSNILDIDNYKGIQIKRLQKKIGYYDSSVIHSHTIIADLSSFLLSLCNKNVFLMSTFHNFFKVDLSYLKGKFVASLMFYIWRFILVSFDKCVCISSPMLEYYRQYGFKNLELIYNFRDITTTHDRISKNSVSDRIRLVFVGGLNDRKNILNLFEFISRSNKYQLDIIGDGKYLELLNLNYRDNIVVHGPLDNPVDFLTECDILVLPSFAEGFPLVCIEAIAVGIPCLLSDIPVHRELSRLGFGLTFNHLNFLDFDKKVDDLLLYEHSHLQDIYNSNFTSSCAFNKYFNLFPKNIN